MVDALLDHKKMVQSIQMQSPGDDFLMAGAAVHLKLENVGSLVQEETDLEYPGNEHQQMADTDYNNKFGLPPCQLV